MKLMRALAVVLLVGAIAVAASSGAHVKAHNLSAPAFRKQASTICRRLSDLEHPATSTTRAKLMTRVADEQSAIADLAGLRPPRMLAASERQVIGLELKDSTRYRAIAEQVSSGAISLTAAHSALVAATSGRQEARIWRQLGVPGCLASS